MSESRAGGHTAVEAFLVALLALGLYLPFLAIQYDPNGISEAASLDAGQLINKNHMLYRPIGLLIYRAAQHFGYDGTSLLILQTMNAVCGAVGIGLSFAFFKAVTRDRAAAAFGSFWLATSFVYWMFSTDAAYITLAGMFALAAMVCAIYAEGLPVIVASGIFTILAILTWQACLFLIPALLFVLIDRRNPAAWRHSGIFIAMVGAGAGAAYLTVAFVSRGLLSPRALWSWFTGYSEANTLPLWGVWSSTRLPTASVSAARSVMPVLLAVFPGGLHSGMQLGRIAVDFAILAMALLLILALMKIRAPAIAFLAGYALLFPFIVWWDPFEPKWFLIPNIFLGGFLACGLQPWLRRRRAGALTVFCALSLAGTNFITTIWPRHKNLGPDRSMAQCVAQHMNANDAFLSAEWGWTDYLGYVHSRAQLNLINESVARGTRGRLLASTTDWIASVQNKGGKVYMLDPNNYSQNHLSWLAAQTGLTLDDLKKFGGVPAFICEGKVNLELGMD